MSDADVSRLPGDGSAATVVLLRDGELGVEVLLAQRPFDRGSYAGAWVFPGGAIDEADAAADAVDSVAAARRAAVRETAEEIGLRVDPDELVPFAVWHPPIGAPKRLHTWFFAARMPDGEIVLAPDELVRSEWVRPSDALERHAADEAILYPPTWVTLHLFAGATSVGALLTGLRSQEIAHFVGRFNDDRTAMYWREDEEYEARAPARGVGSGIRHRLLMHERPWVYERRLEIG